MGLTLELIMPSYSQRFAFKPKPRKILKALRINASKIFLVVLLIGNCYKKISSKKYFAALSIYSFTERLLDEGN